MLKAVVAIWGIFLISEGVQAKTCEERRGALDFGSGTTKAYAAVVDTCKKRILSVIFEERLPLALNEGMEKSESREIPLEIIDKALPTLQGFLEKMNEQKVNKIQAVATSVFRVAKNGSAVIDHLEKNLNIPIQIISQEKEAELGFWSALAQKNLSASEPVVVWDIGGGSMQMYALRDGKTHIYKGNLASVTFKNQILEVLQFKDPKQHSSPNPIGIGKNAALQLAKNHAYLNVPSFFKAEGPKARWIGVGGVLSMSVQKQTKKGETQFSRDELTETLSQRVFLKDSEIPSDYRISDISNLVLVLGYMQALQISQVETVQASLGQGLLYRDLENTPVTPVLAH